jgi:hypothetical protein
VCWERRGEELWRNVLPWGASDLFLSHRGPIWFHVVHHGTLEHVLHRHPELCAFDDHVVLVAVTEARQQQRRRRLEDVKIYGDCH